MASNKSIIHEMHDIQLAVTLITLGARLQMLETETQLSRGRLIRLYKELRGCPPPKGMLPFSTDWFMIWEHNIHASIFYNTYLFLIKSHDIRSIEAVIGAYKLYLEQCPDKKPLLGLTRAWTLVRFVDSQLLQLSLCKHCRGSFVNYANQPLDSFVCSLCHPPSRAMKRRVSPAFLNDSSSVLEMSLDAGALSA